MSVEEESAVACHGQQSEIRQPDSMTGSNGPSRSQSLHMQAGTHGRSHKSLMRPDDPLPAKERGALPNGDYWEQGRGEKRHEGEEPSELSHPGRQRQAATRRSRPHTHLRLRQRRSVWWPHSHNASYHKRRRVPDPGKCLPLEASCVDRTPCRAWMRDLHLGHHQIQVPILGLSRARRENTPCLKEKGPARMMHNMRPPAEGNVPKRMS
jgi:hypothetical protein